MIENLFNITGSPNGKWSVSWPNRGSVKQNTHKELIVETAVKTGTFTLELSSSDGKNLYLDHEAIFQKAFYTAVATDMIDNIVAVKLDKLEQAEQFVDMMEKHIVWKLLTKEHHEQT